MHGNHYTRLVAMALLSFIAMYILMYAMVDRFSNVLPNFNQFYMAGLMASPMVVIELLLMGMMYPNKKLNAGLIGLSVLLGVLFWMGIRQQVAIDDEQFLKSMIPHHGAAILMCNEAPIRDPEIQDLCDQIRTGQQSEIDFMQAKLQAL